MHYFGIRDLREKIGDYAQGAEAGVTSVISRNGTPLTVNIPFDDLLIDLGAHKSLAIKFYQEEVLTLNKAARLAGVKVDEFIAMLGSAGISVLGDADEIDNDLQQF